MEEYWIEAYNLSPNSHLCVSIPICKDWSEIISTIWKIKDYYDCYDLGLPSRFDRLDIKDKNKKETLVSFVYNEEKKGYRPLEPAEWE